MATKIRLQRHGRKKRAFFHIVVADSRAPRNGRFIEKLGSYNPITNPATIQLDVDKAAEWLMKGAQPSDTANAILSYKGALYRKHLQVGVNKGAITQEQADAKFAAWMQEKEAKIQAKRDGLADARRNKNAEAMKAESKRREAIAAKILAKNSELSEEVAAADETVADSEITAEETNSAEETPAVEESPATEESASTEEAPAAE
ncbi:MAG: 30S ribosomal protein S16 [Bacteroidetes bacterium]|nr:30S ribosomal protein S16 [Bacteroidota bacterium]